MLSHSHGITSRNSVQVTKKRYSSNLSSLAATLAGSLPCSNIAPAHITHTHHARLPCTLTMHACHAHPSCTLAMHTCHARSPCTLATHTCHAHSPCTLATHTCHARSPCTLAMHTRHAHSPCTLIVYTHHACLLSGFIITAVRKAESCHRPTRTDSSHGSRGHS